MYYNFYSKQLIGDIYIFIQFSPFSKIITPIINNQTFRHLYLFIIIHLYNQYYIQPVFLIQNMTIRLQLLHVSKKLEKLFPNDPHFDIRISLNKQIVFKLQKAYLRMESNFFKKFFLKNQNISEIQIKEPFKTKAFEAIMKCFYGGKILIARDELISYLQIVCYLQIQEIMDSIRKEMRNLLVVDYDIFGMIQICNTYQQKQLYQIGLDKLQGQKYNLLLQRKFELFTTSKQVFKYIISRFYKWKSNSNNEGPSHTDIYGLIRAYVQSKQPKNNHNYRELYLQLLDTIDKNLLTSQQYQIIFMSDLPTINLPQSKQFIINTDNQIPIPSKSSHPQLSLSSHNPFNYSNFNIEALAVSQNTFYRKRTSQLKNDNEILRNQIINLKNMHLKCQQYSYLDILNDLKRLKQQQNRRNLIFCKIQHKLKNLESQSKSYDNIILENQKQIHKLKNQMEIFVINLQKIPNDHQLRYSTQIPFQQNDQRIVNSMILPAAQILKIAQYHHQDSNNSKSKQSQKQSSPKKQFEKYKQQQIFTNQVRLEFSCEPLTISSEKYHILQKVLDLQPFKKVRLELLYRCSVCTGQRNQFYNAIKNKSNLLILIDIWETQKSIGAYISAHINTNEGYIQDSQAFIFSLNEGKKFKTKCQDCIYLGQNCLLAFSEDLVIKQYCLSEQSQCNWPISFECDKTIDKPVKWLTGDRIFQISEFEVYQISWADIEMIL